MATRQNLSRRTGRRAGKRSAVNMSTSLSKAIMTASNNKFNLQDEWDSGIEDGGGLKPRKLKTHRSSLSFLQIKGN
jgi:hypothetical protein